MLMIFIGIILNLFISLRTDIFSPHDSANCAHDFFQLLLFIVVFTMCILHILLDLYLSISCFGIDLNGIFILN